MTKRLSQNIVNLEQFPTITDDIAEQITIGDLHANALKLLHLLIQEGVVLTTPERYHTFFRLYHIPAEHITKEELTTLFEIINQLEVRNPNVLIRLIGDEHFDRGCNDLYIDIILRKLHQEDIDYEIILSNHGARSILQIENFRSGENFYDFEIENEYSRVLAQEISINDELFEVNETIFNRLQELEENHPIVKLYHLHFARMEAFIDSSKLNHNLSAEQIEVAKNVWEERDQIFKRFYFSQTFDGAIYQFYYDLEKQLDIYKNLSEVKSLTHNAQIMLAQRASFKNLHSLLDRQLIVMQTVEELYDHYYTPYLKLLSYNIDPQSQTLTLFSHAPCGLECINRIANLFSIPFQNHTLANFAQMLDAINHHFVTQFVQKGRISELLDPNSFIYQFIWNRQYDVLSRPHHIFDYAVYYAHGHDNDEEHRPAHVYCLDSRLGSIALDHTNIVPIMVGEDLVLKSHHENDLTHLIEGAQQAFLSSIADSIKISPHSWRSTFEFLVELFKSFITQDASFDSFISIYCKLIQDTKPRASWALIEPQITCLEKIISLMPAAKMISAFSIFANDFSSTSVQPQLDALKTFLQEENPNTLSL